MKKIIQDLYKKSVFDSIYHKLLKSEVAQDLCSFCYKLLVIVGPRKHKDCKWLTPNQHHDDFLFDVFATIKATKLDNIVS